MNVEIDTHDRQLVSELFESPSLSVGQQRSIPGGATVTYQGEVIRKAVGIPETIMLTVALGTGTSVVGSLIANWLYDKLKGGRAVSLRIDRREVQIEDGEIKRVVEETIRME